MEEAFDLARDGRLAVTPDLIDCGLKACDVIRLIIEAKEPGEGTAVSRRGGSHPRLRTAAARG